MRVGVDATCWLNTRGYGRHARALLSALLRSDHANQYVFYLDGDAAVVPDDLPANIELRHVRSGRPTVHAAAADGRRSVCDMWRMSRALSRSDCDVLLFPTIYSYVPVWGRAKRVVMIHDVIAEKFPQLTFPNAAARLAWHSKVALGRWQADSIATVSEYSKARIVEHFGVAPERVAVVGEASDPVFRVLDTPQPGPRLAAFGIGGERRSIVYVGGFGPHKNLSALVNSFARIVRQTAFADTQLIMVGDHATEAFHTQFSQIRQQVEALQLADRVVFTGFLPDEELVVLLNLATVLALPSWMEGFGLPAVEAAACGLPVVATTASPLPDLLGVGGLYIDPARPAQLTLALERVLGSPDLRHRMRTDARAAAARLTWQAAAAQMRELLQEVGAR
jgi:glycosyltransferase involved in cell wall biosynthesis